MGFVSKFLMKKQKAPAGFKEVDLVINRQIIVDQVASFLYATKQVPANMDITNIQFGELFGASTTEHTPMKIFLRKEVRKVIGT